MKTIPLSGMIYLVCLLTLFGSMACQQAANEMEGAEESGILSNEGLITFEGIAKVAHGKYLYVPERQGFDIVVNGPLSTGDLSSIVGKEIRGEGRFSVDRPSILVANSLEVKDESGIWNNVFTLTNDALLEDYLDLHAREEFLPLDELAFNKAEDWENLEKGKVLGRLEEVDGASVVVLFDENDREKARIIVDQLTDYSRYYIQKLNLFDRFWFYLTIKDTVDWNTRRKTHELFHADILFAGLF